MKKLFITTILLFCLIFSYAQGVYRDAFSNDGEAPLAPFWSNNIGYAVSHVSGSGTTTITRGSSSLYSGVSYIPYQNPQMGGTNTSIPSIDMTNNNDTIFVIAKSSIGGALLRIDIIDANNYLSDNFITSAGQVNLMNQHALTTSYSLIKFVYKIAEAGFNGTGCTPNTPCPLNKATIKEFIFHINPADQNFSATVDIDYFQVGGTAPACPGGAGNSPTADAGPDVTVCSGTPLGTFNGNATNANFTYWNTIDDGTFSAPGSLSTTYTDGKFYYIAPIVLDVYSANGCGASDVALYIITQQTINAGSDQTLICGNPSVTLNGVVTGETTAGTWSGGTGTFNPNANTLNATYTPSASEIAAGTVTLTLSSVGGSCPVSDQMTINIMTLANAGIDQTLICGNTSVALNGSVTGATGGTWSGGTGAFSPNANTLNATYFPSVSEIAAGTVALTLTSVGGACSAVSDNMIINITALANAGSDQALVCGNTVAMLNGSIIGATGGTWSGGTGTFSPNAYTLNATYTLSVSEIAAGTAMLTLTSTGGVCPAVSDNMVIHMGACTGVTNANNGDIFRIFPNPNKGDFTIHMSATANIENAKIEIINIMGEIMISKSVTDNSSVDVNNLSKGMYSVKLTMQNNQYLLEKFIVE
jgi:hypothetical protein